MNPDRCPDQLFVFADTPLTITTAGLLPGLLSLQDPNGPPRACCLPGYHSAALLLRETGSGSSSGTREQDL